MQVVERFKQLSRIARCSHFGGEMLEYLEDEAKRYGYGVHSDDAGNLLCVHEAARVTLQAHYDMVCIGRAPDIEIYEEEGWLKAKESTLGADNGIAMAMMLELMAEGALVSCLFTADEEVGLLGARALELPLQEIPMLNLDSEAEGEVTIGCAGGVDIVATKPLRFERSKRHCYRVEIGGLPGGHSGVDIDKKIPNAIKELAALLERERADLVEIGGGERRNAIPKSAYAVIATEAPCGIEGAYPMGEREVSWISGSSKVVAMLHGFAHGVREMDERLGIVHSSINLALLAMEGEELRIQLSARAMAEQSLKALEAQSVAYFEGFGCRVRTEGFYAPWPPEENPFALTVREVYREACGSADFSAIHAGLECGVIKERYPAIDIASIGPNIVAPHSTSEAVEIASAERIYGVVKGVIERLG